MLIELGSFKEEEQAVKYAKELFKINEIEYFTIDDVHQYMMKNHNLNINEIEKNSNWKALQKHDDLVDELFFDVSKSLTGSHHYVLRKQVSNDIEWYEKTGAFYNFVYYNSSKDKDCFFVISIER